MVSAKNTDNISQVCVVLLRQGRQTITAVADDFSGHALQYLIVATGFGHQVSVVMAVAVKKTGTGDQAVGIDDFLGPTRVYATVNLHDPSLAKGDMSNEKGVKSLIDLPVVNC